MAETASSLPSSPQSPKKRHTRWWIIGIVILAFLSNGGACYASYVGYTYFQTLLTPQKTLSAFCNGWITKDAWGMFLQEDAIGEAQESLTDLQQLIQNSEKSGTKVRLCFPEVVKADWSTAVAGVYLSGGDAYVQSPFRTTLALEDGRWFITSFTESDNGIVS